MDISKVKRKTKNFIARIPAPSTKSLVLDGS